MKISQVKDKFKIEVIFEKKKPNWNIFSEDLKEAAAKRIRYSSEFLKVLKFNEHTIREFKKQKPQLFGLTIKEVFDKHLATFSKPILEGAYSLPQNDADISIILDLLRNGIKIEEAYAKLSGILETDILNNQILEQQEQIPNSNFAQSLTNLIVNLEPKTPQLRKLQNSIFQDQELSALILPKYELPQGKSVVSAIHECLLGLRPAKKDIENIAFIKCIQYNESYKNIKNQYFKQYKEKSLLPYDVLVESAFEYDRYLNRNNNSLSESQVLNYVSANFALDEKLIVEKYEEIFNDCGTAQERIIPIFNILKNNLTECLNKMIKDKYTIAESINRSAYRYARLNENFNQSFKFAHDILNQYCLITGLLEDVVPFPVGKSKSKAYNDGKYSAKILDLPMKYHEIPAYDDNIDLNNKQNSYKKLIDRITKNVAETFADQDPVYLSDIKDFIIDTYDDELINRAISLRNVMRDVEYFLSTDHAKKIVAEDVVNFTGNNQKQSVERSTPAQHLEHPAHGQPESEKMIYTIVGKLKSMIDTAKIVDKESMKAIAFEVNQYMHDNQVDPAIINKAFEIKYGQNITDYIVDGRIKNQGITESITPKTANRCMNSIYRFLKKLTDSSNIVPLSNFDESYEKKDKIVLRLNVFENNPKKLQHIKEKLAEQLVADGWRNKADKFIKGTIDDGSMITLKPIKRTFRQGKNREIPALGIEIIGSKRIKPIVQD